MKPNNIKCRETNNKSKFKPRQKRKNSLDIKVAPRLRIKVDLWKILEKPLNHNGFLLSSCSHDWKFQVFSKIWILKSHSRNWQICSFIANMCLSEINGLFLKSINWFWETINCFSFGSKNFH